MKRLKTGLLIFSSIGLIFLGACSNESPAASSSESPAAPAPVQSAEPVPQVSSAAESEPSSHAAEPQAGGQVVESGPYHLELVAEKELAATHVDFFLQKGANHEAIPDAKVTAQVQLPDGTQKTLNFAYDPGDKHYTAVLPGQVPGEYKVAVLTDINGEKVNGRFTFNR